MFSSPLQSVVYCHGGRIGFFQGDIRLLSDDMKALRPTIFPVVPRLLNRMYDKVSLFASLFAITKLLPHSLSVNLKKSISIFSLLPCSLSALRHSTALLRYVAAIPVPQLSCTAVGAQWH